MGKIQVLSAEVANQVAAGEIVERPASIVKELFENSVDAGATRIDVDFWQGGIKSIRISDNGCGMDREDAVLSLQRHATSKIRSAKDLESVATMGFRGEALPSIASVSRFKMTTAVSGGVGTEIVVEGGVVESVGDVGAPSGTVIEMKDLFFNMPARRKFLRGVETESAHIVRIMEALAIAHPRVGVSLTKDGRRLWVASPSKDLSVRLNDVFGRDFLGRLMPLDEYVEGEEIAVSGFLAKPGEGRPDREQQFVVLNGRIVHCPAIYQSLKEAYIGSMPAGKHPLAVLRVDMDPLTFDCNVHPAKREVRLHRPEILKRAIFTATRQMLDSIGRKVSVSPSPSAVSTTPVAVAAPAAVPIPIAKEQPIPSPSPTTAFVDVPVPAEVGTPVSFEAFQPSPQIDSGIGQTNEAPFRIVGELGGRWIIAEGDSGLVLLDVRKAEERILFERILAEASSDSPATQRLLLTSVVELPAKDAIWLSENLDLLAKSGFSLEPFGSNSFKVDAVPPCLADADIRNVLLDVCASCRASGGTDSRSHLISSLVRSVSGFANASRFVFSVDAAHKLLTSLLGCDAPYTCPRGKPTMVQWSFAELDRKFGGR